MEGAVKTALFFLSLHPGERASDMFGRILRFIQEKMLAHSVGEYRENGRNLRGLFLLIMKIL